MLKMVRWILDSRVKYCSGTSSRDSFSERDTKMRGGEGWCRFFGDGARDGRSAAAERVLHFEGKGFVNFEIAQGT